MFKELIASYPKASNERLMVDAEFYDGLMASAEEALENARRWEAGEQTFINIPFKKFAEGEDV
jgi:hypothetical protein